MSVIKKEHRRGVRLAAEEEVHMQKSDGVTGIGQMTAPPCFLLILCGREIVQCTLFSLPFLNP